MTPTIFPLRQEPPRPTGRIPLPTRNGLQPQGFPSRTRPGRDRSDPARATAVRRADGRVPTILVVEDDEDVREMTVDFLRQLGYRLLVRTNAPEAAQLLEGDEEIDLLFSDVVMPGRFGGTELAVIARERRPGLPILLCSGYIADELNRRQAVSEFVFLPKPYRPSRLAELIKQLLTDPTGPGPARD